MKRTFSSVSSLLCAAVLLLSACSDGEGGGSDSGNDNSGLNGASKKGSALSFDMGAFSALAIADGENANSSRSARSATTESMLVKILEDGSIKNFINVPDGVNLSPIKFIAQSPAADGKEIYIVMDSETYYSTQTSDGHWTNGKIGQLLCVLEDGTYYDVLSDGESDDNNYNTYKHLYSSSSDSDSPIVFDQNGYMYYRISEGNGMSNTNVIYKFDASTGSSKQLTPKVENTYYEKMQVSKDGVWIFANASRYNGNSSTRYLQAIPTAHPESPINLFYSSGNSNWIQDWYYDDDAGRIYFIQNSTVYYVPLKDGTFDVDNDKTILFSSNSNWFYWDSLLTYSQSEAYTWKGYSDVGGTTYYFRNPETEEHEVVPGRIADYLLAKAADSMVAGSGYSASDYEIKFDSFANVSGYEQLATAAAGKADGDAIAAITEQGLVTILHSLWDSTGRYAEDAFFGYTSENFFADVLYKKSDGSKIARSMFENNVHNSNYFASCGISMWNILTSFGYSVTWKKEFLGDDNKLVPVRVLEKLAEMCGKSAIDFSLEAFRNKTGYTALYTELKNEDAISFLNDSVHLQLLSNYLNSCHDTYNGSGKFLLETCFVRGSNYATSAYKWRNGTTNSISWGSVNNLTSSYGDSLYGIYTNWNENSSSLGLVKIVDEDGHADGTSVEALKDFMIVECQPAENGLYFKNAILTAKKEESGKHNIQYYDVLNNTCTNLFDNVENKDSWEVISFSVGGDYLYYSAVSGFDVTAGKINVQSKEVTTLSSSQKLTKIISIK
ncbi:MAG: hypothetical protein K6B43_04865 [Treponema sp.]|nr:hypothetical protein [Treponema sp.]